MTKVSFYRDMIIIMILLIGCAGISHAKKLRGTISIYTVGTETIEENNVDQAREAAIQDALAVAVETTVDKILPPRLIISNFKLLNDRIYNPIQKFIKGFRVLAEAKSNNFYRVLVKSSISVDTLRSNLKEIGVQAKKKKLPSVLMFISEQNLQQDPYQWWRIKPLAPSFSPAGDVLTNEFKKKNYRMETRSTSLVRKLWARPAFQEDELNPAEAIQFAKTNHAQVVLIGFSRAFPSVGVFGAGMASIDAEVEIKAYQTQTGMMIAETTQKARAVKANELLSAKEAIKKAASQAAQALTNQIETGLKKAAISAAQVELHVSGTKKLAYFVAFRKVLSNDIKGVSAIQLKELKANEATIIVDFAEGGKTLAKRLMLKSFDNFGLNMIKITSNKLTLALVSKKELDKIRSENKE